MSLETIIPREPLHQVWLALFGVGFFVSFVFLLSFRPPKPEFRKSHTVEAYLRFIYTCFIKPHTGDATRNQQDALESFYQAQASIYDTTRSILLKGREDMLGLVAAQLKHKVHTGQLSRKPIWVDVSMHMCILLRS
jgi:betaine lipid synthase